MRIPPRADLAQSTLRDDLAGLVARAVREGNYALAKALIDAQAGAPEALAAGVVDLGTERARRGGS